jgi:hypothetical protein
MDASIDYEESTKKSTIECVSTSSSELDTDVIQNTRLEGKE